MEEHTSSILSLPNAVLHEVISWSPNSATARALVRSCRTVHEQCLDPNAAALLLIRCTIGSKDRPTHSWEVEELRNTQIFRYRAALASCHPCHGGTAAVVQQLLHLVQASPDSGGPMTAPIALLQAALCDAASGRDVHTIHTLMALPQPPDVNAGYGWKFGQAALSAMDPGKRAGATPHLGTLQALLDCGADPAATCEAFCMSHTCRPEDMPALLMLLSACPADPLGYHTMVALETAGSHGQDPRALDRLLMGAPADADRRWDSLLSKAAANYDTAPLGWLLDHRAASAQLLTRCLGVAAAEKSVACVALLLDRGAAFSGGGDHEMEFAMDDWVIRRLGRRSRESHDNLCSMLVLLLQHGATMTLRVSTAAEANHCTGELTAALKEVAAAANREPESLCVWCGTWCRTTCLTWRALRYTAHVGKTLPRSGWALYRWWSECIE